MAGKTYFNGLAGVVVGSITGIVLVHRFGWNQWWQIVGAIIVGGLFGLTAADSKWVLGKLGQSYKNFFPKEEETSAPEKKRISAAQFFFKVSVTTRWILTSASVFSLFLAPVAAKIFFNVQVNLSPHDFAPSDLVYIPFVLLICLPVAFFLTPLFEDVNFLNRKYWNKSKLCGDGSPFFSTRELVESYGFWEAEKRMLLIGVYATFRVLLLYLQLALFIPANIFFLLVALTYLLRAIGKSARHLLIFLNIALGIVVGACCSSLMQAMIWGVLTGVFFYHVSHNLPRLRFAKFSEAYRGYSKIWCWKFS